MKKLKMFFVLSIFLLISSVAVSQTYYLKTEKLTISDGYGGTESYNTEVDIKWDIGTSRMTIYSKEPQVIDYTENKHYIDKYNYAVFECSGTDTDYVRMGIEFQMSNDRNHVIILIFYNNIAYSYSCKFV